MNTKFIPEKLKVGFKLREDTYSAKLAYIIYWDAKGTLRKENSWNSWRDDKIPSEEFKNEPTEGFVLNRNGGGGWGSNSRNEFIRVYDPRGFEIEISLANLLFILQETNSIKGKGLEGEFVYCWEGPTLILLPVGCQEYSKISKFTNIQSQNITAEEGTRGNFFIDKMMKQRLFLERGLFYKRSEIFSETYGVVIGKRKNIFWDVSNECFVGKDGWKYLAAKVSDTHDDWENIIDKYSKTIHTHKIEKIITKEVELVYSSHDYYDDMKYFLDPQGQLVSINCRKVNEFISRWGRPDYPTKYVRKHRITHHLEIEGSDLTHSAVGSVVDVTDNIDNYTCVDLLFQMDDGRTIQRKSTSWQHTDDNL